MNVKSLGSGAFTVLLPSTPHALLPSKQQPYCLAECQAHWACSSNTAAIVVEKGKKRMPQSKDVNSAETKPI